MKIENIVSSVLRHKPETRASNDLLWVEVCKALCSHYRITTLDDFFLHILSGQIPSSHTTAAAITNVRKTFPELRPTEEQIAQKQQAKENYINEYRNA